jgi:hypothetical protein
VSLSAIQIEEHQLFSLLGCVSHHDPEILFSPPLPSSFLPLSSLHPTFVQFDLLLFFKAMGIANFPFPSFTLLLTSDRVVIPGPSYVIRLAPLVVPQVTQDTPTVIETLFARHVLPTNRSIKAD